MKKSLKTLLIICCMALCLTFCLTACGDECEHTYDNACDAACNECGEERTVAHTWQNADCDTPKACSVCSATEGNALGHTPEEDDGDCTTDIVCSICRTVTTEGNANHTPSADDNDCSTAIDCANCDQIVAPAKSHDFTGEYVSDETEHWHICANDNCAVTDTKAAHAGGTATCTDKAVCSTCNLPYGEINEDAHAYGEASYTWSDDYNTCTAERSCSHNSEHTEREEKNSTYADGKATAVFANTAFSAQTVDLTNATQMTADKLKAAVAYMLSNGETDIYITFSGYAYTDKITAIRRALCDTAGVADGSINLTLAGFTYIPNNSDFMVGTGGGYAFGTYGGESVTRLRSVSLPDATDIGDSAFSGCSNLKELYAPKVTYIGVSAFNSCASLTFLELSAEGNISVEASIRNSEQIALRLNSNKKDAVTDTTWNGFTFRSVELTCTDGSFEHTYGDADNHGDETHSRTCSACSFYFKEACHGGEATCGQKADCAVCGVQYGEVSAHIINSATGECRFGCGTPMAVAKVTLGDSVTYYDSLVAFRYNKQEGATVTLLTNNYSEYMEWMDYTFTLDLNGYNLSRGMSELYASGDGKTVTLANTGATRAYVGIVLVYRTGNVTFTVKENADVGTIELKNNEATVDLSAADFTSCQLKVTNNGCNTSQFIVGGYAIYDADGNIVEGELTNGVTYTIKATA